MGSRGKPRGGAAGSAESLLPTGTRRAREPSGGRSRAERRKLQRKVRRRRRSGAVKEVPLLVGVAVLIALVLKTFLLQAFVIPSGSMEQTIRVGDRVIVDKLTPWFGAEPQRGDVVVFSDPGGWLRGEGTPVSDDPLVVGQVKKGLALIGLLPSDDEQDLIKRVVGVGGDRVRCCDAEGRVTVNGVPLDERAYLYPGDLPSREEFDITVPDGRLWVMGDHRSASADSREHQETYSGTVSKDDVLGRAMLIAWPFGHWATLDRPDTYAAVPDAESPAGVASAASHRVGAYDAKEMIWLPIPAVLPLVMGVLGPRRARRGRRHGRRSWRGGCGGWRTVRTGWRRRPRAVRGSGYHGRGRRFHPGERRTGDRGWRGDERRVRGRTRRRW
ncbi:signal peptidase I [Streptomyces sp. HSG2]|uniref:signal peptidase I n=1 Tax=Streptomyces sp. HSG2 TaxID=2797167 RepID=UPI001F5B7B8A|nr:signal peptidase I [Streptomyces sp. HSG2]